MKLAVGIVALGTLASIIGTVALPANADTYMIQSHSILAPRVVETWMQPTVVRSSKILDENGDHLVNDDGVPQFKREAIIQERRERVIVPTAMGGTTEIIRIAPMSQTANASIILAPGSTTTKSVAEKTTTTTTTTTTNGSNTWY